MCLEESWLIITVQEASEAPGIHFLSEATSLLSRKKADGDFVAPRYVFESLHEMFYATAIIAGRNFAANDQHNAELQIGIYFERSTDLLKPTSA